MPLLEERVGSEAGIGVPVDEEEEEGSEKERRRKKKGGLTQECQRQEF